MLKTFFITSLVAYRLFSIVDDGLDGNGDTNDTKDQTDWESNNIDNCKEFGNSFLEISVIRDNWQ